MMLKGSQAAGTNDLAINVSDSASGNSNARRLYPARRLSMARVAIPAEKHQVAADAFFFSNALANARTALTIAPVNERNVKNTVSGSQFQPLLPPSQPPQQD